MTSKDIRFNYFQNKRRDTDENGIYPNAKNFATNWWAKKWLKSFKLIMDGKRIKNGKKYALKGQVVDLLVKAGLIEAKVQCSKIKPYNVRIEFNKLTEHDWQLILTYLSSKLQFSTKLYRNTLLHDLKTFIENHNIPLFPKIRDDLQAGCNCPDWANPCKHIAAVYLLVTSLIDQNPFIIFKIRGKRKSEIIEILHQKRVENCNIASQKDSNLMRNNLNLEITEETWNSKNDKLLNVETNDEFRLTELFNESPFTISNVNISTLLENSYEKARAIIEKKIQNDI